MSCKIRRNRHGFLAYRVYWRGVEFHEGTGLRDTPQNREKLTRWPRSSRRRSGRAPSSTCSGFATATRRTCFVLRRRRP